MATINGISYQDPKNINLKGTSSRKGSVLRFAQTSSANPLDSTSNGLYINASNQLIFSAQGTATVIGAAGAQGQIPSLDAIFQGDQTLNLGALSTLTIDRTTGNNNILTLTNTGAGSGVLLQITNVGTGYDIAGTNGTWFFTKLGAGTQLSQTISGTAASTVFTVTAGDLVVSDGSLAMTDADDAASFTVTNNTAATASMFVIAGSGTFTGSTTTSFMTITPSGLTTGTALYLPVLALTTGKGLHINYAGTTSSTSGVLLHLQSAATAMTSTGRMLKVEHTGITGVSTVLAEVLSAATDETTLVKITASAALALGVGLQVSASSMTTGKAIIANDLDSLTTGMGLHLASAATAITTTGRLFLSDHTGATGTTATLNEFKTAATDETILLALTTAAMINGVALSIVGTTGMTTGSLIRATSSTAGAVATNGVYAFGLTGAFTSTASTLGAFHIAAAATITGTAVSILGGAMTSGIALNITDPSTGMTSGSLLRVITATTGAVATNGIVSIQASGAYTSTSNAGLLDVSASATTAGTVVHITSTSAGQTTASLLNVTASGYNTGYTGDVVKILGCSTTGDADVLDVQGVNTTAGNVVKIQANAITLGAATGLFVTHTTSVLGAGSSLVRISSTGIDTGTTTGTLLDLSQTAAVGNVAALITDSSADTAARTDFKINVTNAAAVGVIPLSIQNAAVTGANSKFKKIALFGSVTVYVGIDAGGNDPGGQLTGVVGDICLNGASNKGYTCTTAPTTWTAWF